MKSFSLQLLFRVIGIGSASGILLHEGSLFLISDNSTYLYHYDIETTELTRIPLAGSPAEQIAKPVKPDFEALTLQNNQIEIFGSGSTDHRTAKMTYDLSTGEVRTEDLTDLYKRMQEASGIPPEEFNIEGAVYGEGVLYLFQRGNGTRAYNGIFIVDAEGSPVAFRPIKLPLINHVASTFTDATLVDGVIYFLAAAENSASTYLDGEVVGCLFGSMDVDTFIVRETIVISSANKFEGIAYEGDKNGQLSFLLCEDRDDDVAESAVYRLLVKK